MIDGDDDEGPSASIEEAFGLIANETRVDVLRALWEATRDEETPVPFSALRKRAAVRDSGQFNYHLDKLVPRFVRTVEDGYELTYAGEQVVGAAVSGVYTEADAVSVDPVTVRECPICGSDIEAGYADGYVEIGCTNCEMTVTRMDTPPIVAGSYRDAEESLPSVFSRYLLTEIQGVNRGFCQRCSGRVDVALDRSSSDDDGPLTMTHGCRECGQELSSVVASTTIDHPAVIGFLFEHGIDLRGTPIWELDFLFAALATVVDEDPLRVAVTIELDGDALSVTLDESFDVVEWSRE